MNLSQVDHIHPAVHATQETKDTVTWSSQTEGDFSPCFSLTVAKARSTRRGFCAARFGQNQQWGNPQLTTHTPTRLNSTA